MPEIYTFVRQQVFAPSLYPCHSLGRLHSSSRLVQLALLHLGRKELDGFFPGSKSSPDFFSISKISISPFYVFFGVILRWKQIETK